MTYLEAKKMPIPVPETFRHKRIPLDVLYPVHWNDVRFNHHPGFFGRRCFIHDTYFPKYDIDHDVPHSLGFKDEDLDYEQPDPIGNMHFKRKRSQFVHIVLFVVWAVAFFGYATAGLKIPQKDNPFYFRKKFATDGTMHQMQEAAAFNYEGKRNTEQLGFQKMLISDKGIELQNQGLRFNFAGKNDLYC
eukprot:CAMPEP_0205822376 /NCGR_PEP_ID=MMETSP0206-20130828/12194_1 /ASSEMBLY_ACC=CAM_ASM_000279 /TAXON_ID=36767 /ORGANISM="Euplotes focardii, Strain TN1" /LENGTH=188 /DNA_ID=CAMNT_0053118587 /DNA_START=145 /DNA_END=711 /DNA_ORIENTATION=+